MDGFEARCGVAIAIFAAVLALNDMFAGKAGEDEIKLTNDKSAAYSWYQSKSIKETLTVGQANLMQTLLSSGAIQKQAESGVKAEVAKLLAKSETYEKQKNEILLGSNKVGKENWAQDVEGKLGEVKGAKEIEDEIAILAKAGDRFDLATLLLQLCLVMGAISLILKKESLQKKFFQGMLFVGLIGAVISVSAIQFVI